MLHTSKLNYVLCCMMPLSSDDATGDGGALKALVFRNSTELTISEITFVKEFLDFHHLQKLRFKISLRLSQSDR